jgi:uncharacterized protein (TIGR02271 family)
MSEHIVAIFDKEDAADAAAHDLEDAGISASAIRRYRSDGAAAGRSVGTTTETTSSTGGGFWAWLLGEEPTEATRSAYSDDEEWYDQRTQAGNTVLSVMVHEDAQIHQVVTILDSHHPIGMEENTEESTAESRSAGGQDALVSSPSGGMGSSDPTPVTGGMRVPVPETLPAPDREEVIPLAEEKIEIGKRTVDRGTTRIRRYVVETPVEQDLTLHGERVTIERRRPAAAAVPGHAFEERTVEVRESDEVPVIEKTARVVEEVAIRKEETERTETVRDKVRREHVEVTDEDGQKRIIR